MIPCLQNRANEQVNIQLLNQLLLCTNQILGLAPNSSPPPIVATAPPIEEYAAALLVDHSSSPSKARCCSPFPRFMLEGYDRDDIYVMVEDEFHAVARSFTKHLHHAEYERFKALAKERNSSTASTISRPVDSITAMRAETKKKKEAEARDAKNKATLERFRNPTKMQRSESDISDPEDQDKDTRSWKGTALQDFMRRSIKKNQTSLIGLGGVKSSTRAAAGYSKSEKKSTSTAARSFDLAPHKTCLEKEKTRLSPESSTSDGTETDDLDAPAAKRAMQKQSRNPIKPSNSRPEPPTKPPERKNNIVRFPHLPPSTKNVSSDRGDDASGSALQGPDYADAARARLKARMEARKAKESKKDNVNVNEIPVFLV